MEDHTSHKGLRSARRVMVGPSGFTLIELLLVMVIMAVLIGIGIGSFSGTIRGMSLTNAGNKVTMIMEAARQRAMAGNVLTAVVLVTGSGTSEDGRALTVIEYPQEGPAWIQIRDWELLPSGIVVDVGNNAAAEGSFIALSKPLPFTNGGTTAPVSYQGQALNQTQFAARVFLPGGGVLNASDAAELRVVEGNVADGKTTYPNPDGPSNYYRITLLTSNGRTKVSRPAP